MDFSHFSFSICILFWESLFLVSGEGFNEDLFFTKEEENALKKLKPLVIPYLPHDYMKQDIYLVRWLRAKNMKVADTEASIFEDLHWRRNMNMDKINEEDWSDMQDDYHYDTDSVDKEGRPIGQASLGSWDVRKASLSGNLSRLNRYVAKYFEELTQKVLVQQSKGMNVTRWKGLFNLEGVNAAQHACPLCSAFYIQIGLMYEQHYPLTADAVILINTPPKFQIVMNAIRETLTPNTRESVKVFGMDENEWLAYLDKEISPDQRGSQFGGVRED